MSMSRKKRARLITRMRRAHVLAAEKHRKNVGAMKASIVSAFSGVKLSVSNIAERETYKPRTLKQLRAYVSPAWRNRSLKYRKGCDHKFKKLNKHWKQCKRCAWCVPRKGKPPHIALPPVLKGRRLPTEAPLDFPEARVGDYGIIIDKYVRLKRVQYGFKEDPLMLRYGVEVRFKELEWGINGWCCAAIVTELQWHKLARKLLATDLRKPKKVWKVIQKVCHPGSTAWLAPWLVALGGGRTRKRKGGEKQVQW